MMGRNETHIKQPETACLPLLLRATHHSLKTWKPWSTLLWRLILTTGQGRRRAHKWYCSRYFVVWISINQKVSALQAIYLAWRLCTNDSALLSLLERLGTEGGMTKNLWKLNLDCWALYSSEPDEGELKVAAGENFVINRTKSTWFHDPSLYPAEKPTIVELYKVEVEFATKAPPCFLYFTPVKFQDHSNSSGMATQLFFNNIGLLYYDHSDKKLALSGQCKEAWKAICIGSAKVVWAQYFCICATCCHFLRNHSQSKLSKAHPKPQVKAIYLYQIVGVGSRTPSLL